MTGVIIEESVSQEQIIIARVAAVEAAHATPDTLLPTIRYYLFETGTGR